MDGAPELLGLIGAYSLMVTLRARILRLRWERSRPRASAVRETLPCHSSSFFRMKSRSYASRASARVEESSLRVRWPSRAEDWSRA